jgi:hypothetical protein
MGIGMGTAAGLEVGVTSYRRDDAFTVKRGEGALEEADVRREAWYARLGAWNAAEGDEGADMVGEDEVSMSRLHRVRVRVLLATGGLQVVLVMVLLLLLLLWLLLLGLRLEREMPAAIAQYRHSRW